MAVTGFLSNLIFRSNDDHDVVITSLGACHPDDSLHRYAEVGRMLRPRRINMQFTKSVAGALLVSAALFAQGAAADGIKGAIKHVLLISVDGLHDSDLSAYVAANPTSAMATLAGMGIHYDHASAAMPSDSFPGLLAIVTGGSPKSTGVYYDDSYDRVLSAPGSDCSVKGSEIVLDESLDVNTDSVDAGGGIDPTKLPRDGAKGCAPLYPHSFLRVNTIFEVIKSAGMPTAWSDKHPAYDLVNGPSGKGVDDLYTPEINVGATTDTVAATEAYDDLKVTAVLNEIGGKTSAGKPGVVPAVFGMNFQAVSVGQKTKGYSDAKGMPSTDLADALKHTDASLGKFLAAIKTAGIDKETLVIVSAKHGQSAIDPTLRKIVDSKAIGKTLDKVTPGLAAQVTADDVALIWLTDQSKTADAVKALEAAKSDLGIDKVMGAAEVTAMFGDAMKDSRVPDVVIVPVKGVIYTKPTATKLEEHGGFTDDDVHVPVLVANPAIKASTVSDAVGTASIAPTILAALGLDPMSLQAVKSEGTKVLPGLGLDK